MNRFNKFLTERRILDFVNDLCDLEEQQLNQILDQLDESTIVLVRDILNDMLDASESLLEAKNKTSAIDLNPQLKSAVERYEAAKKSAAENSNDPRAQAMLDAAAKALQLANARHNQNIVAGKYSK